MREIKDAALKAEILRKEKPIKPNNEMNNQEDNIDVVYYNNRGNFQNNYRGNQQNSRGRGGYPPA
jgi:hypothetical protein